MLVAAVVLAASVAGRSSGGASERLVVLGHRSAPPVGALVWRGTGTRLGPARLVRGVAVATLSFDGRTLATAAAAAGGRLEIRVRPVAGGAGRLLARVVGTSTSLAFSPDGARLAYASSRGIELAGVRSGTRRVLALPRAWRGSTYPALAFSRDGTLLALTRTAGDGRKGTLRSELDVVGVDGHGARRLYRVQHPFSEQARPTFSADGERIAFVVGERSIHTVAVTGGRPARLTAPPPRSRDGDPIYSPDGAWLAFPRTPTGGTSDVYAIRADGTGLRRLTTTPIPPRGEPHAGSSPLAWSPDGTRLLAFRHDRFAVVDVATRKSVDLRRTDVQDAVGPARWVSG